MSSSPPEERPPSTHVGGLRADEVDERARPPYVEATPTGLLRIDAIVAGTAAQRASDPIAKEAAESVADAGEEVAIVEVAEFELPDWASPPTGQIPRVLLEASDVDTASDGETLRGPTWRQEAERFLDEEDMSFLIPEHGADAAIAGRTAAPGLPFEFELDEFGEVTKQDAGAADLEPGDETAWNSVLSDSPPVAATHARHRHRPRHSKAAAQPGKRSLLGATITGLVLGAIAALCFFVGALATVALVIVAVTIAAGELFAVLQRVAYRPATLIALATIPAMSIAAYARGPIGIVAVAAVAFLALGVWFLSSRSGDEPVVNLSVSLLVIAWVGGASAIAGLLLSPKLHPHGHGVALVASIIVVVVANDIGAYLVGSRIGRHRLAAKISPGKTIEGVVGGGLVSIIVAGAAVAHIHPLHLSSALLLGLLVAVIAPCGDLLESRVKRDLGVKDMSNLLPNHGGLFDRIDAMLFVLPAAYLAFSLVHVS